jgi:DNA-binding NtrC family response regulator
MPSMQEEQEGGMKSILVVSASSDVYAGVRSWFPEGYRVDRAAEQDTAVRLLRDAPYGVLLIDVDRLGGSLPDDDFRGVLQPFWRVRPAVEIILMTPQECAREGELAARAGVTRCLTHPIDPREGKLAVENAFRSLLVPSEAEDPLDRFWQADSLEVVRTRSPRMQEVYDKLRSVASTRSTVLLTGETGTGKGVLARLIHRHSNRKHERLVSIHCGAIPDTLVESELFGHEKGAFTGAVRRRAGKFETARGGTIFLDEVGTITEAAQVKLLQVLHEGMYYRVGGEDPVQADVRVLAATNSDLEALCEAGRFRRDLYYRLNVFPVAIPPLRERTEDIPYFIDVFLTRLERLNGKGIQGVDPAVVEAFKAYPWPGNIRELENLIERAYILETSSVLSSQSIPAEVMESCANRGMGPASGNDATLAEVRRRCVEEVERAYLRDLLARHTGKMKNAAATAGISPRQLYKLMHKYGLRKESFRRNSSNLPTG